MLFAVKASEPLKFIGKVLCNEDESLSNVWVR